MPQKRMIAIAEFCSYHKIEISFIEELYQHELIELITERRKSYIAEKNLHLLEKIVRLYTDLHINIEGIQTILHLLTSLEKKETELTELRNRLEFFS